MSELNGMLSVPPASSSFSLFMIAPFLTPKEAKRLRTLHAADEQTSPPPLIQKANVNIVVSLINKSLLAVFDYNSSKYMLSLTFGDKQNRIQVYVKLLHGHHQEMCFIIQQDHINNVGSVRNVLNKFWIIKK